MWPASSCPVAPHMACAPGNGGSVNSTTSGPTDSIRLEGCLPEINGPCMLARETKTASSSPPTTAHHEETLLRVPMKEIVSGFIHAAYAHGALDAAGPEQV